MITNTSTFNVYFYDRCYLRFSSDYYDINDTENLFIHLTNNSVVKYSTNFKEEDSMWHSDRFKDWLILETGQDIWESIIEKIKGIIQTTISLAKQKISQRRLSFELLGYDFMIDKQFNPWLIEINASPCMDYSTVIII